MDSKRAGLSLGDGGTLVTWGLAILVAVLGAIEVISPNLFGLTTTQGVYLLLGGIFLKAGDGVPRLLNQTLGSRSGDAVGMVREIDSTRMPDRRAPSSIPIKGLKVKEVFYATHRGTTDSDDPNRYYGSDRGDLSVGTALVSIPARHKPGRIERPMGISLLRLPENPRRHIALLTLQPTDPDSWIRAVDQTLARSTNSSALLFVHGYNVDFAAAVRRTAQLVEDLAYPGVPLAYSWPSQGTVDGYLADEATVQWAEARLADFLRLVVTQSDIDRLDIVAHSMGNRLLVKALVRLGQEVMGAHANHLVLAAPDVDAELFEVDLAPQLQTIPRRLSLYASSEDKALAASRAVHKAPRAGEGRENVLVIDGMDTVDASNVDTDFLGHGYFAESKEVIDDLYYLINQDLPPSERNLRPASKKERPYWLFP